MAGSSYLPADLSINQGDSVHWTNSDAIPHSVTSGVSPTADGVFDSGLLFGGDDWTYTFDATGSYDYYCIVHPSMVGTVTVAATCQGCVCAVDATCCDTAWDESCAATAAGACDASCGCN